MPDPPPSDGDSLGFELFGSIGAIVTGALLGMVTASVLDAVLLAGPYERAVPMPVISASPSGTPIFGLGGRF